jgi:hypothetical protein
MADIVGGFKNQIWRVIKYDGLTALSEERIPLSEAGEEAIVAMLQERAKLELTSREVKEAPHLLEVRRDYSHATRITYAVGENPHYTASLWRADELDDED